jgi:hypothetical protein
MAELTFWSRYLSNPRTPKEKQMKLFVFAVSLAVPLLAHGQSAMSCPMHEQHEQSSDQHAADVETRGDHAMGFSHEKSAHHFYLLANGGTIEVVARDANDAATRDEIRMHLSHIAGMFSDGDFQVPMFIHDTVPPGVPVMKSKRGTISYVFAATPNGGQVRIASADPDAVKAIHEFLSFQIEDHRTGDSKSVVPSARE